MSNEITKTNNALATLDENIISSLIINGDLKNLNPTQKVQYYNYRCQQAGLDPSAKPFDLLILNGKHILYANATCTQQLCSVHKLSTNITHRELVSGIYTVAVKVSGPDGRATENMGAVNVEGLKSEALANAMMKATTKAIRRTVLAHCGLGMLDETEVETIPGAQTIDVPAQVTTAPKITIKEAEKRNEEIKQAIADLLDCQTVADLKKLKAQLPDYVTKNASFIEAGTQRYTELMESVEPKEEIA